jgi:hypothetical protein
MGVGDSISLDSDVELRGENEQFDPATYVASAVFNSVAFPSNMPEYLRRHIEAEAAFAQRLDDAGMTIGGANGGPIGEMTKAERLKKADEESAEYLGAMSEESERREREREEWSRTTSTVAGVSMTGAEWAKLAERLRNDEDLHRRLIEIYRARGMTGAEAEARYDRVAEIAGIAAIPPNQRTDVQRGKIESAESDPSFKRDMNEASDAAKSYMTAKPPSATNAAFTSAATGTVKAVTPSDRSPALAVTLVDGPTI